MKIIPVFLLSLFAAATLAAKDRPNVVIFLADDQGWGDVSIHGNKNLSTPHLDTLAKDGALFTHFFVCPVCAPTRAEFLTGRYYSRTGVRGVSTGQERLNIDEVTIADTFKNAGYATGAFGKWHNGMQHPYHPNARGFDEYYGFCSGHWGNYYDALIDHNNVMKRSEGYITDAFTNKAIEFIEQNKDQPFFCYVPYCTPHSPMQVPDKWHEKFAEGELAMRHRDPGKEQQDHLRAALAMCENIDWNVGRVLKKLDELDLAEDTIVIYFSDNGPNGWRWNGDMKGKKGAVDEGGVRVPFFIRWPGKIPAGTKVDRIAGAIDLLPTLANMCKVPMSAGKPIDGRDISPLLSGDPPDWEDRTILSVKFPGQRKKQNLQISARNQRYRLDPAGQLFDLFHDPGQRTNIAKEKPRVVQDLKKAVDQFAKEELTGLGPDERPFPVGFADLTPLPGRDGEPHGNVERSGRAPNCSYFTNWKTKDDKITWHVETGEPGIYDAFVYYTCPEENVGAKIKLSGLGGETITTVTTAHDPPAYGKERDHSDRGSESFVKDFRIMSLGRIQLNKGTDHLTLQAVEIPGEGVIEVRYLMLRKVKPA